MHEHEGVPILETLTQRLASQHRECLSALSLFSTLISLHCEDLMFQLILRFLVPCNHLLWTQRSLIRQNDCLSLSAERFLNLTPKLLVKRQCGNGQFRINEDLSLSATDGEPNEKDDDEMENDLALVGAVPGAIDQIPFSYMDYLEDSRNSILSSLDMTSCWLFNYDGINPGVNFLNELKPIESVVDHVQEKTEEMFLDFLASENSELVTLDALGINVSEVDGPLVEIKNEPELVKDMTKEAERLEKPVRKTLKSRTEVDEFYRALMGETSEEPETLDESTDLSKAEENFTADITAVEVSLNEPDENENQPSLALATEPDESKIDEDEKIDDDSEKHENSILELSHVEEQLNDLGDELLDHQAMHTIHMPVRLSGAPYLGPFLSTMFGRLEQMPTNSLYLNLMLTGIIAQLAAMSLPLLRGLLLDTRIVFQPGVPSLYKVLTQVKGKLEAFASSCPDYVQLCERANQFLLQRESEDLVKSEEKRFDLKELEAKIKRKKDEAEKMLLAAKLNHEMKSKYVQDPLRVKNAIYASVVLKEVSKELAALAHQHSVSY